MQCAAIARWLLDTKGIAVQDEWLGACIEWIFSEEGSSIPQHRLQEMVYDQWLHADLKDVVVRACIPETVTQQQRGEINGKFIVQVNSIVDVGKPAYSQLQKLKGQSIDSAEGQEKKFSEPKPTRLLLLYLTDGVTELQAMEYQQIPHLNAELLPGTKLILQGVLQFNLGVLLLSASHVQVLGGRVDNLVELNQPRRVLARILNNEELAGNTDTNSQHTTEANNTLTQTVTAPSSSTSHPPSTSHRVPSANSGGGVGTGYNEGAHDDRALGDVADIDYGGDINMDDFEDFGEDDLLPCDMVIDNGGDDVDIPGHDEWPDQYEEDFPQSPVNIQDGGSNELEIISYSPPIDSHSTATTTLQYYSHGTAGSTIAYDSEYQSCTSTRLQPECVSGNSDTISNVGLKSKLSLKQKSSKTRTCVVSGHSSTKTQPIVASVKPFHHNVEHSTSTAVIASGQEDQESLLIDSFSDLAVISWKHHPKIKIKAHFVKVCQRMSHDGGEWLGTVIIGDEFGAELQVHISNEVLEPMIGFTAKEFRNHINPNKMDPKIRAKASRGFAFCQSTIASLNCFMVLEKRTTHIPPFIVQLLDN